VPFVVASDLVIGIDFVTIVMQHIRRAIHALLQANPGVRRNQAIRSFV
jgi:hypothetical protein